MLYQKNIHKHIHKTIKKYAPISVRKAKHFLHFKYEKFFLLIFFIFLSYIIFKQEKIQNFLFSLNELNYIGFLIAGILFPFGFSAPISLGFFIVSQPQNIFLATIFAGIGSAIADILLFKIIKKSFKREIKELNHERIISTIKNAIKNNKNILIKHYFFYIFAGIILATPLPDEIGISMLAGLTTIKISKLAIIAFILHSIAIFIIIYLGAIL
ncbi:MAG: hypothetical protein QXD05_00325 [Candidatus Pacearchaeota archaeon]